MEEVWSRIEQNLLEMSTTTEDFAKKYHQMMKFLEFEVRLTVRMRCVGSPGREGVHCMFGRWGALVASWQ